MSQPSQLTHGGSGSTMQMVDIDAVLAVHALQQEQPPPQPVDNVAASVNSAPAKPMQRQPRFRYVSFLVPSVMLFVHRLFGYTMSVF